MKRIGIVKKKIILLFLFVAVSVCLWAESPDKSEELYSPEYAALGSFVTSYTSPQADAVNPAASALTQRVTLDLSYFAIAGSDDGVSGLQGNAVNLGATLPTKLGVFSFSSHFLDSDFPGYSADTDLTLKGSFAKELYPGISTGIGLGFGLSGSGGFSTVMDLGLIQELGSRGFIKDLRWGGALKNIGYTSIDDDSYPDPFTPLVGARALLYQGDSFGFALNTELGFPGFSNTRLALGGEFNIGQVLTIHAGTRMDFNQLDDGDTAQMIPSVGIVFNFTTDFSDKNDFLGLSERGWDQSEVRPSFTVAPVIEDVWAIGGGVNIPLGVIDKKPPEIDIDIDGIVQDGSTNPDEDKIVPKDGGKSPKESSDVATFLVKGKVKAGGKYQSVPRSVQQDNASKQSPKENEKHLDAIEDVVAYLSPNNDGVKDDISVPVKITDSRYVMRYQFLIENEAGSVVRVIENKEKRIENQGFRGFFDRLLSVKSGINIPDRIRWDGTDKNGAVVPDGLYSFYIQAYDDNGNMSRTDAYRIVVDNTPPEIHLDQPNGDNLIFSPNDDGNKDTITFEQKGSYEEVWNAEILDASSTVGRHVRWPWSSPESFIWDGTDDEGILLPDGVYSYRISATDRAGNSSEARISNIIINTEPTPISLSIERSHFSPNGDGVYDTLLLTPEIPVVRGIEHWSLTVEEQSGGDVRTYKGMETAPGVIAFDGKDDTGFILDEGSYKAELQVLYRNGNFPSAISPVFTIDVAPPSAMVRTSDSVLSPDGDGNKDTITLYQETSLEQRWEGVISRVDGDGDQTVRDFTWIESAPAELVWDGTDNDGRLVPDGLYRYILSATDRAGNTGHSRERTFSIDTSKTEVIFTAEAEAFSPNGDGVKERMGLIPKLQRSEGIDHYVVTIKDAGDKAIRTIEGSGSLPESLFWDGRDNDRRVAKDGMYRAELLVVYDSGYSPQTTTRSFELDTIYPAATISTDWKLFSPDGDGRKDTIVIRQEGNKETLWSGEILNAAGESIKRAFWKGNLSDFSWDGTGEAGNKVPDGSYSYRLTSTDKAGNHFETTIAGLIADTTPTSVFVTADAGALSPNGDGKFEDIGLTTIVNNKNGISGWSVELVREDGTVERRFSGEKQIPTKIVWDGKNENGNYVEGSYRARFTVSYEKGNRPIAESSPFFLDRSAPEIAIDMNPVPFSPDNDGVDDELTMHLDVKDRSEIDSWTLTIYDPEGKVFKQYGGSGSPADQIIWDGKSDAGELVYAAMDYPYRFSATDVLGNRNSTDGRIPVDVLVVREGNLLKIKIASIIFQPNKAEFVEDDPEVAERNRYVLDRLAEILQKYRSYQIMVEGHAALINWADPVKAEREEQTELMPLSQARAEKVVEALVERGIDRNRLDAVGVGGTKPLVPHSDIENRWKNRRVEFILEKKR